MLLYMGFRFLINPSYLELSNQPQKISSVTEESRFWGVSNTYTTPKNLEQAC